MIRVSASPPRVFTLVLLSALPVLSLNMFLPSLSNMAEEFRTDYALVSLSIAGYLAITAASDWPALVYDYMPTRNQAGPQAFLRNYGGYLQGDAYPG